MQKIYVSQYREYVIQLVAPKIEMINGASIVRDHGRLIRFSGGRYITADEGDQGLLEANPAFGCDYFDLLAQENEAKKAQAKVKDSLVEIVEGARRSDQRIKKTEPTKPPLVLAPPPAINPAKVEKETPEKKKRKYTKRKK